VFAAEAVPQVFAPYELDGAINSLLATRSGLGRTVPLTKWRERAPFGRRVPPVDCQVVRDVCQEALGSTIRQPTKFGGEDVMRALNDVL
jgi:hypothetical protein